MLRLDLGPIQRPTRVLGIKQPAREVDDSPPHGVAVSNERSYTAITPFLYGAARN